jgi:uncharacterized protein YbjT (DUF2867 family)
MSHIAVIGGHGKVALHLSRILSGRGHQVSSLIRNPDHREDVAATGAEPVVADVESLDAARLDEVLDGHDAVVWSAGAGGGSPQRTYAVDRDAAIAAMDAAGRVGIKRFVMVSYFGSSPDHGVPEDDPFFAYAEAKAAADEHLRGTDLDWTVLGPSGLTDDPSTGRIDTRARESAQVPREDVALVVAETLELPATVGRTIRFNSGATPIRDALTT